MVKGTFCTSGMALMKAGKGVCENFYSGMTLLKGSPGNDIIDQYIVQAEGLINSVCRYNFTANYSLLSGAVREILQEVASNLAGIYLIEYDMSGYTSRVEAEDNINILRDATLRGLSLLRDKKVQDFINGT